MKQLLKYFFTAIILLSALNLYAATAKVHYVRLEHGAKVNNRTAMKIHTNFTVYNGKGQKMKWCVWIQDHNGNWHKFKNGSSGNNYINHLVNEFTPTYSTSNYNGAWAAIYVDDLNLLQGKHEYKVYVTVNDYNGNILGQSDPVTFTGTGSGNSVQKKPSGAGGGSAAKPSGNRQDNNGGVKTWREELGYGGFVIVKKFPNGYIMRTRYRFCPNCNGTRVCGNCHGTGACPICNGNGGIISAGYGNYYPCYSCQTTGRCMFCKGNRGCTTCAGSEYPGYVIGSTSTIAPDGSTTHDRVDYNGYDHDDKGKGDKPSGNVCRKCGGTGVNKTPNSGGSRPNWVAWYNKAGTECPYCGRYTAHYHDRCASCNVP
ncbi:MAG: hypothetical protein K2M07_05365 [Muribaculaceae bacterium]|nr:hypothetical protein [Muribaculaceae bacterium]